MSFMRLTIALTVLGAFCLLPFGSAFAQSDDAYIQYRQKLMQGQGGNMGAIATILKGKLPLTKNIATHARALHEDSKLIASAFEHKAADGKTDAEAKLWNDWSEFKDKAADLQKASAHLATVADSGDMGAIGDAVKAVGKTCGGCHKEYRKPKEESYKNKM